VVTVAASRNYAWFDDSAQCAIALTLVFIEGEFMSRRSSALSILVAATGAAVVCVTVAGCGGGANAVVPRSVGEGQPAIQRDSSSNVVRSATSNTWSTGATAPTKRYAGGAAVVGSNIYVVGGYDPLGVLGKNEIYDTTTNTWKTGASMPTKRYALAAAAVNGIVYAIGGADVANTTLNTVEAYDPVANTWSTKATLPTAVDSIIATVDKGLIYIVGGYNTGTGRFNGVQVYNPTTNVWTSAAPLDIAKSYAYVGTIGTSIVAAGGLENTGNTTEDNEVYSPHTNSWTTKMHMTSPRQAGCAGAIGNSLYAAGGVKKTTPLNHLDGYDITTNTWTGLAPMPFAVIGPESATANGLLYCIGGSNNGDAGHIQYYNYVQIYQP
jgi:N-acetylneuraminic acid mutarotase